MAQIQDGRYTGRVLSAYMGNSKTKGTPAIHADCCITEKGVHFNRKLPWEGWLTEGAFKRTIESMILAGARFKDDDLEDFEGLGPEAPEVEFVVENDPYVPDESVIDEDTGKPRVIWTPRVAFINPLGGGRSVQKIEDPAQRKAIAKTWGKHISAIRAEMADRSGGGGGDTSFDPKKLGDGKPVAAAATGTTAGDAKGAGAKDGKDKKKAGY